MGWRTKKDSKEEKKPLFSSRVVVQAMQIGANSFRYVSKRVTKPVEYEEQHITPTFDDSYTTYNHGVRRKVNNYVKPTSQSKYAWKPTQWSSFNWNYYSSYDSDADDNDLFVKTPENYLTPTVAQIKAKVNVYTRESICLIKEATRVCYFKMINDRDYINKSHSYSEDEAFKKKTLYDSIYETFIPGTTPLEQAISIYWKTSDESSRGRANNKSNRKPSHTVEFKRENYADAALNNQLDDNYLSSNNKLDILNRISILGDLGNQFQVEKEVGEFEVHYSDTTSVRLMRSYEEIDRVELYQRVLPNFDLKFYNKDLMVTIPVTKTEKKQKIIILIDYSGSMNEEYKQLWVNAILVDRFRYVIKGEAEIIVSFFVSNPNDLKFFHVKTASDVDEFWKTFSNRPNGNCTNIGRIVKYVAHEIEEGRLHNLNLNLSQEKPEILIINDGQDSVGYNEFGYKVNAISIDEFSDELKDLCIETGGKQVQITSNMEIFSYAEEDGKVVRFEHHLS